MSGRRGFSLVEVLVVIAVVSVLISVLLPGLAGAREASMRTRALVNARTLGVSFEAYMNQSEETYPFIEPQADPGLPGGRAVYFRWWPENTVVGISDVFALEWAWPALISEVSPWTEHFATWVSPGRSTELPEEPPAFGEEEEEPAMELVSWRVSSAFFGDPAIWDEESPRSEAGLVRAVRRHEVVYPSNKVLAWDTHLEYLRGRPGMREGHWDAATPMVFADGHAEARNPLEARAGVANGLRFGDDRRLHNTAGGVKGVDY